MKLLWTIFAACMSMEAAASSSITSPEKTLKGPHMCPDHPGSTMCRHPQVLYDPSAPVAARNNSCAAAQTLNQVAKTWQSLETKGTRETELQRAHNQTAATTLSPELGSSATGLFAAMGRILGVTAHSVKAAHDRNQGHTSVERNERLLEEGSDPKRSKRVDAYPQEVVYAFFHVHEKSELTLPDVSQLVKLDKNKRENFKGKRVEIAGLERNLTCVRKKRTGTLSQLSAEYLQSKTHEQILAANPMLSISASTIQSCICPCITEETISECVCPICAGFESVLEGLDEGMAARRRETGCKECSSWASALKSPEALSNYSMCAERKYEGFDLSSGKELILRPFCCCLSVPIDSSGPCPACGIQTKLPTCSCVSPEALSKSQTWLKQQPTLEGKNHDIVKDRFRDYVGTVGEAYEEVISNHKGYELHRWRDYFMRHQFHLDCENFDGESEIVVLADFASAMKLGSGMKVVCESDYT